MAKAPRRDRHVAPPPPEYGMWLVSGKRTVQRVLEAGKPALKVTCVHKRNPRDREGASAIVSAPPEELIKLESHMRLYPCGWTRCPRWIAEENGRPWRST